MLAYPKLRCLAAALWLLAAAGAWAPARAQVPNLFPNKLSEAAKPRPAELVKAELLADRSAVVPGKPLTVGLHLQMAPEWHTYWEYSGDAGLPTKIAWQLPEGFQAGPIQWPVPDKIVSPGDIVNYGYSDEVMLLVQITPPATLPPGNVTLKAKADWLVCRESCIPGSKELALTLPTGGEARAANAELFHIYQARLPQPPPDGSKFQAYKYHDATFLFTAQNVGIDHQYPADAKSVDFLPLPDENTLVGHPVVIGDDGFSYEIRVPVTSEPPQAARFNGVIAYGSGERRRGISIRGSDIWPTMTVPQSSPVAPANTAKAGPQKTVPAAALVDSPANTGPLPYFLLIGFLGGLILNVMPCVLPVISLKLFSFVKQANQSRDRVFKLGLAYAAGVFAWFLGFAALVVALKAAGHQVGYAFHLQNPWFLVGLSAVTFVFALNLLGVFEVILPGSVTGAAGEVAGSREGYTGAFLQGMLATVLGSACTAPFFGPALGFAFSQNGPVVFAMFAAIAAGMSAPFVLLAARPGWMKFLPKPGVWMERVKQGTGFLMLATMLWLLFSLGRGLGADAVVWTGMLMLVLGVACWVQGTFNTLVASDRVRWASRAVIALLVLGGGWACVEQIAQAAPPILNAQPFAAQLEAAQKSGRIVFVDLTAEWCVSCKANEKAVLATDAIQKAFRDDNVDFLTGDFTTYSADIANLLKQYNAPSVPLYLVYPAGKSEIPIVLPPILTKQTVLDALTQAQMGTAKPVAAR